MLALGLGCNAADSEDGLDASVAEQEPSYLAASAVYDGMAWDDEFSERLRHRLEVLSIPGNAPAGDQPLYLSEALLSRYDARGFEPVWFDEQRRPLPALFGLVGVIEGAAREGLRPEDYHLSILQTALEDWTSESAVDAGPRELTDVELLASDAFLSLAAHYAFGRLDPVSVDPGWHREPRELRELPAFDEAAGSEDAPGRVLAALLPSYPEYELLRERLSAHLERASEDNWEQIASGSTLRPGESDPRVPDIRERLAYLGDLPSATGGETYDEAMAEAVRHFQERHGLAADAAIGPRTLAELNVTPEARARTLRANMERWRWLPADLGDEYILVNIAGFSMDVVQNDELVMRQRVIVGLPYRRTPVFTGNMTYLVLNPTWEVPHSLAVRDQLPRIRQNPGYLDDMGFSVLQGWGASERRIDPATVNWASLGPGNFPYRLRQRPGPQNAMGRAKFMFPNRHNVYLHDTPQRGLFAQSERAFSSGCIRVEDPVGLAEWLLGGEGRPRVMGPDQIRATLNRGQETTVRLGRALPVHLLYWTAWVDDEGRIQYRRDIYERDGRVLEALDAPPPGRHA